MNEFAGKLPDGAEPTRHGVKLSQAVLFLAKPAAQADADRQAQAAIRAARLCAVVARIKSGTWEARSGIADWDDRGRGDWIRPERFQDAEAPDDDTLILAGERIRNLVLICSRKPATRLPWLEAMRRLPVAADLATAHEQAMQARRAAHWPSLRAQLAGGTLRAFGRTSDDGAWCWSEPAAAWTAATLPDGDALVLGGTHWCDIHVHAPAGMALPPAALALAPPGHGTEWLRLRDEGTDPDRTVLNVQREPLGWRGRQDVPLTPWERDDFEDGESADGDAASSADDWNEPESPAPACRARVARVLLVAVRHEAATLCGDWWHTGPDGGAVRGTAQRGALPRECAAPVGRLIWWAPDRLRGFDDNDAVLFEMRGVSVRQPVPEPVRGAAPRPEIDAPASENRAQVGRPAKWPWDEFMVALGAELATKRNLPRPDRRDGWQAELERWGAEWFTKRFETHPVHSEIRERVSKAIAVLKQSAKDNAKAGN